MARPGKLVHLVDLANLITLGGLSLAFLACWAVLSGWPSLAMSLAALERIQFTPVHILRRRNSFGIRLG